MLQPALTAAGAIAQLPSIADRLCSVIATRAGQDPIGSTGETEALLVVEVPTPWGESLYEGDANGAQPWQRIRAFHMRRFEELRAAGLPFAGPRGARLLHGIAPDPEFSDPSATRAIVALRPAGSFANYDLREYRFPAGSFESVALAQALFEPEIDLSPFEDSRSPQPPPRQLFVCTHGHVDICCAKFGIPLYRDMRAHPGPQTWRTTHFGGHRFAPTVRDFPSGYTWGFLDAEATQQVLHRDGPVEQLARKMRGWAGCPSVVQPLDREGFLRFGWDWLDFPREGAVLEAHEEEGRWHVRMTFTSPGGAAGSLEGVVVRSRELRDQGCGADFGLREHDSPEYNLESFTIA